MATPDVAAAPSAGAEPPNTHNAQIPNREVSVAHDQARGQPIIGATDFIAQLPESKLTSALQRAFPVVNPDSAVDPDFNNDLTITDGEGSDDNDTGGVGIKLTENNGDEDHDHPVSSTTVFAAVNTKEPNAGRRHRIKSLKDKTKAAIKDGFQHGRSSHEDGGDVGGGGVMNGKSRGLAAVNKDLGDGGNRNENNGNENGAHDHGHHRMRNLLRKAAHPKETVKGVVMSGAGAEVGEISQNGVDRETDQKWVDAHDRKEKAMMNGDGEGVEKAEESIEQLSQRRKEMQLRMVMRQIDKVQTVKITPMKLPTKEDYVIRDENGEIKRDAAGIVQYDWPLYAGELALYYCQPWIVHYVEDWQTPGLRPLDPHMFRIQLARLLIASGPWQQWYMHIRSVYRWDNPMSTFRWLCLYAFLWYTSHVVGFLWFWGTFATIKRYIFPPTLAEVRENNERATKLQNKAVRIDQVAEQADGGSWLEPFTDSLGPWAQMQLKDLADFLEILNNFYEWTSPRTTLYSVCFLGICFFITLVADMDFCVRCVELMVGFVFFCSFPISSKIPKYRYVVSPVRWGFWNVPTNAEWAFAQLRFASQARREKFVKQRMAEKLSAPSESKDINPVSSPIFPVAEDESSATSDSGLSDSDDDEFVDFTEAETNTAGTTVLPSGPLEGHEILAAFPCTLASPHELATKGNLLVTPQKLKFVKQARKKDVNGLVVWEHEWSEIREMAKTMKKGVREVIGKRQYEREGLELEFMDGKKMELEDFRGRSKGDGEGRREEAFCEILGASGIRWQWKV